MSSTASRSGLAARRPRSPTARRADGRARDSVTFTSTTRNPASCSAPGGAHVVAGTFAWYERRRALGAARADGRRVVTGLERQDGPEPLGEPGVLAH